MEPDTLRSCPWSNSSYENSKSLNDPPKITSSLWKQLSEEQDLSKVNFPAFTESFTQDKVSSECEANQNFPSSIKSKEMWKSHSSNIDTDISQLNMRNPWNTITNTSHRSGNLNYLGLPSNAKHSATITEDIYGKSGKENNFIYTRAVGNRSCHNNLFDKPISITKDLLPHQDLSSNVWATNPKAPSGSSNQDILLGSDSFCHSSNPMSWMPVNSSLRPALRNIENISNLLNSDPQKIDNLHQTQIPSEFSPHQNFFPFGIPSHDSYYNQQANIPRFQPQKQHTDLVALMQELSVLTDARDMGNLSHYNNALPTYTSEKPVSTTPVPLSSKGCVFCKNNNYHSTFYKSHVLKDERGHCQCPVLRMYVCPLCNATGDSAHTLKYCPRNTVTKGDPIAAGLPPGKVTNWREVANRMMGRFISNNC